MSSSTAAARARRYRDRRDAGLTRIELWLNEFELLGALEDAGRLTEPRAEATARLVKDWIAFVTRDGRDPVPRATVDVKAKGPSERC